MAEVKHLNFYLKPEMKEAFQAKIINDGILDMQVFFKYFINLYANDDISFDEIAKIKEYQDNNPGKIEEVYIKVLLTEEQHKELALKKIFNKIKPPYICRYYLEQYLNDKIPSTTIETIKNSKE